MDEAMNPLTMLTFGSYGQTLANQQGAPVCHVGDCAVEVWVQIRAKSIVED